MFNAQARSMEPGDASVALSKTTQTQFMNFLPCPKLWASRRIFEKYVGQRIFNCNNMRNNVNKERERESRTRLFQCQQLNLDMGLHNSWCLNLISMCLWVSLSTSNDVSEPIVHVYFCIRIFKTGCLVSDVCLDGMFSGLGWWRSLSWWESGLGWCSVAMLRSMWTQHSIKRRVGLRLLHIKNDLDRTAQSRRCFPLHP